MNYEIKPHTGVGPINFGMIAPEIRRVLHTEPELVDKGGSGLPAHFFRELGFFIYYRDPGLCEAIEFFGPVSPSYKGQYLLGQPYATVEKWIKSIDSDVVYNDAGLITKKHGFGLYAPFAREKPDFPVEAVIVFERGYYDR